MNLGPQITPAAGEITPVTENRGRLYLPRSIFLVFMCVLFHGNCRQREPALFASRDPRARPINAITRSAVSRAVPASLRETRVENCTGREKSSCRYRREMTGKTAISLRCFFTLDWYDGLTDRARYSSNDDGRRHSITYSGKVCKLLQNLILFYPE